MTAYSDYHIVFNMAADAETTRTDVVEVKYVSRDNCFFHTEN